MEILNFKFNLSISFSAMIHEFYDVKDFIYVQWFHWFATDNVLMKIVIQNNMCNKYALNNRGCTFPLTLLKTYIFWRVQGVKITQ